jgi:hypothetical protein
MLRLVEVALFLAPFALFLLWRLMVPAGGPSRTMIATTAAALLVLVASLIWLRRQEAEPPIAAYVPSRLEGDRIVPPAASVPAAPAPAAPVAATPAPAASR